MRLLDDINIIPVQEFSAVSMLQFDEISLPRGNRSTRKKKIYLDCICAFDIETTRLPNDNAIMYIWQFCINGDFVVIGRTWNEFLTFLGEISAVIRANLVIYVHNLSHEFQFLKGIYDFQTEEIFALDTRKVAKVTMFDRFEFRCSYIHSNMSLAVFTSKFRAKHSKLAGELDYNVTRYPWTDLTDDELRYCVYDVQGLVEAIRNEMQQDGDNLYTIPLTSTGYVRREARKVMQENTSYFWRMSLMPDLQLYYLLREAFRGGNCHANRYYVDRAIKNVQSWDRSSSYPDVQMNCLFPIEPFKPFPHVTEADLQDLTNRGYAYLCRIYIENVRLKDIRIGCPYIPLSKIRHHAGVVVDNGRILSADYLEMTVTDIDLKIIRSQYEFDNAYYGDCWYSHYGRLPGSLREMIKEYYRIKTELKGVEEQAIFYEKTKNKFNSIYGMSAQDPLRDQVIFNTEENALEERDPDDPEAELAKHNKRAVLPYQFGVWTTCWARMRLQEMIDLVGYENFVYTDTDSVYFVGEADFTEWNNERIRDSRSTGAYATDSKGNVHYMGVAEYEKTCPEFRTLGAKKYVYTDEKGNLHCTIAGVVKGLAPEELGSIDNFREGFTFKKAGGIEAIYNDNITRVEKIDGHELIYCDNVCLKPSTYTIGVAAEFRRIIDGFAMLGVEVL